MISLRTVVGAALLFGWGGWFIGHSMGESKAETAFRRMIVLADLTPQCEQMLKDGADAANDADEAFANSTDRWP